MSLTDKMGWKTALTVFIATACAGILFIRQAERDRQRDEIEKGMRLINIYSAEGHYSTAEIVAKYLKNRINETSNSFYGLVFSERQRSNQTYNVNEALRKSQEAYTNNAHNCVSN